MNENELISVVKSAVVNTNLLQSKLIPPILTMSGMSGYKNRHLMNNLITSASRYLEIGCWRGSTFVSALYNNNPEVAFAIDNWGEFNDPNMQLCNFDIIVGHPKQVFLSNVQRFLTCNFTIIEGDCFSINPLDYGITNINTFFYDGEHSFDSQKKALTHYYNCLADCLIFLVDDWTVEHIQKGTQEGIKEANLEVLYEYEGIPTIRQDVENWWEGLYVSVLRKK